jgi:hypothetical protein
VDCGACKNERKTNLQELVVLSEGENKTKKMNNKKRMCENKTNKIPKKKT